MSSATTILVGAVAYHPRIVTIWERFREYFADAGVPTDYVLYSNYERLVDALLAGEVDIALEHEHGLRRRRGSGSAATRGCSGCVTSTPTSAP